MFLILLIWVFSLFFLMHLANGLSILFIFSKNQLSVLVIFAIASFISFSLISALTFYNFCDLFVCLLFFLVALIERFRFIWCLIWYFLLVFWGRLVLLYTSHLELLLLHPIGFELLCFCCHLFLGIFLISLFISLWLLGYLEACCLASMHLYSLQFFPCNWYLVSYHCGQKSRLIWFHPHSFW